jgi:hypothetical protein
MPGSVDDLTASAYVSIVVPFIEASSVSRRLSMR